jgi:hypothetical protein
VVAAPSPGTQTRPAAPVKPPERPVQ